MNNSSESVNMTLGSPQVCSSNMEPVAISWIKTVVYLLLLSLALFGNALVIWVVYKYKRMHTAPNFLIMNIAVSCVPNCLPFRKLLMKAIVGKLNFLSSTLMYILRSSAE